jgi:hypothetical protein
MKTLLISNTVKLTFLKVILSYNLLNCIIKYIKYLKKNKNKKSYTYINKFRKLYLFKKI